MKKRVLAILISAMTVMQGIVPAAASEELLIEDSEVLTEAEEALSEDSGMIEEEIQEDVIPEESVPEEMKPDEVQDAEEVAAAGELLSEEPEDPDADLVGEGALNGRCGENLTWNLIDGVFTISGTGDMFEYYSVDQTEWAKHCDEIKSVVVTEGVTGIGGFAFDECASITSVTLPESLRHIGDHAFSYNTRLESIVIPDMVNYVGEGAFSDCSKLSSVKLPAKLLTVSTSLFEYCDSLTEITIPKEVAYVEPLAFGTCSSLKKVVFTGCAPVFIQGGEGTGNQCFQLITASVYYPANDRTWTPDVLQGYGGIITWVPYGSGSCGDNLTYTIEGSTLTVAGSGVLAASAFAGQKNISTVILPEGLTGIGEKAFSDCTALKEITIPEAVKSIGTEAFAGCTSLSSVTFNGDAPVFLEAKDQAKKGDESTNECFKDVKATVYYFWKKYGWTEEARQNYGGDITWEGVPKGKMTLSKKEIKLLVGNQETVNISDLVEDDRLSIWHPEDETIATVINTTDNSFTVQGMKAGTSNIMITLLSGVSETVKVVVTDGKKPAPKITYVYNSQKGGDIRWEKADGAVGYILYRHRAADGGVKKVAEIGNPDTLQYIDSDIKDNCWGRVYHYDITALYKGTDGKTVESDRSEKLVLQRLAPVKITESKGKGKSITLKWACTEKENKALGYEVQYAESSSDLYGRTGTFKKLAVEGRNNLSATISDLEAEKTYWIRVRCYVNYTHSVTKKETKTWSQYSNVVETKVEAESQATPAYQSIGNVQNNRNGIYVFWPVSKNAEGYNVYRKTEGTEWKKIGYVAGNSSHYYLDKEVKDENGKKFLYTVRGVIGNKLSSYNTIGKVIMRLRTPSIAVEMGVSIGVVALTWARNGAASGYEIQYGTDKNFNNCKTVRIKDIKEQTTKIGSLKEGQTYYFRLRSYYTSDEMEYYSQWSTAKSLLIGL